MKVLLTGKNGQVGWELQRALVPLGEVVALGRSEADLSDLDGLRAIVQRLKPDVIVNAAAYTAVDKAEDELESSMLINGTAPGVLAEEARKLGALLVHYSTDYVFDGSKKGAYVETDVPNPVNQYGRTKLAGEKAVQSSGCDYLIFRTCWVYAARGRNFVLTIMRLAKEREELSVVSDQLGSPTSARLIAETTAECIGQSIKAKHAGTFTSDLYHMAASGYTSWHGFAARIIDEVKSRSAGQLAVKRLKAVATSDYPTRAPRPMNSRLALDKLEGVFSVAMPDWQLGLAQCIDELLGT